MENPNLFDVAEARRLRDRGMDIAASYPNDAWLTTARAVAEMLASKHGEVTIDDVIKHCPRPANVSPNTTGSIFKGKRWHCVGFAQSEQTQRHAGTIRRWVLND